MDHFRFLSGPVEDRRVHIQAGEHFRVRRQFQAAGFGLVYDDHGQRVDKHVRVGPVAAVRGQRQQFVDVLRGCETYKTAVALSLITRNVALVVRRFDDAIYYIV